MRIRGIYPEPGRTPHAAPPEARDALAEHAGKLGIAVEHLESWRDQLAAVDASVGAADLSRAIHARKTVACQVAQLRAAYRASDLPALAGMLLDPVNGDRLLAERNRRWAPLIERYLEHGGGFVAVGLGHLLGDSGLPAMLERAGYRVTREAAPWLHAACHPRCGVFGRDVRKGSLTGAIS